MHFFTSVTSNYIPKARVLARSVKTHNPDAVFSLMLADQLPEDVNLADEPFDEVYFLENLGITFLEAWIFKHSLVELCTAVKGPTFLKIFQTTDADTPRWTTSHRSDTKRTITKRLTPRLHQLSTKAGQLQMDRSSVTTARFHVG